MGKTITYDEIGNPLSDGRWNYTWQHGRQLASMSDGTTTWTYTYDANGMRTSRSNGTTTYSYVYNGGLLSQVKKDGPDAYVLNITYDSAGRPLTVENGYELCYYVTNLQGDVIGIRNTEEQLVTTYTYDAWGNFYVNGSSLIGDVNPLLYRGYVYDYETGLYYLQSRYYNPRWGRFINADAYATTGHGLLGNNMFAYCSNNAVRYVDHLGTYDRSAAIEYAEEWYDGHNPDYYYYRRGDCSNFVSQCLEAGGIAETSEWYCYKTKKSFLEVLSNPLAWLIKQKRYHWFRSDSWTMVEDQYEYFSSPKNGYINGDVIKITSTSQISNVANNSGVQPGDLLFFSSNGYSVKHAAIVSKVEDGMIYYAAHTDPCFDKPLTSAQDSAAFFIIRIYDNA